MQHGRFVVAGLQGSDAGPRNRVTDRYTDVVLPQLQTQEAVLKEHDIHAMKPTVLDSEDTVHRTHNVSHCSFARE